MPCVLLHPSSDPLVPRYSDSAEYSKPLPSLPLPELPAPDLDLTLEMASIINPGDPR